MYSRWYNAAVILLWLASMSWLVTQKVLPPLLVGQPPNYRTIVAAQRGEPPAGWKLVFNGRQLGWAISSTLSLPNQLTEIRSRVHFDEVPLPEMTEGWARALCQLIEQPLPKLQMDAQSTVTIDCFGRLLNFDSAVGLDPWHRLVRVRGAIEGAQMSVSVRAGDFSYQTQISLPPNALLADAFSPQTQLPGLRIGQTWTVPSYNPLRPRDPLDILQATVEGCEPIGWNGRTEDTFLVVYRSDPGSTLGGNRGPRGRLWVRPDGTVLKQQVMLFDASMVFVRLPDAEAAALAETIGGGTNE
jgi:hypothetical protein